MATNGVNGSAPKTVSDFKPEELKNSNDTQKIKNTIFQMTDAGYADLDSIEADGEVDSKESGRVFAWMQLIDNTIGNMSESVKKACKDALEDLENLLADLADTGMGEYYGENVDYDGENVSLKDKSLAYEPDVTDAQDVEEIQKEVEWTKQQARDIGREAGTMKTDKYGNYLPVESSDVNSMYYTLLSKQDISPDEKIKIFSAWLDMNKREMSDSSKEWGLGRLQALVTSAANHKFLDEQIDKYKNGKNTNFFDNPNNRDAYLSSMRKVIYNEGITLANAFEIVNPDYRG